MTRDKAEKLLPIIKAYSEGKEIQVLTPSAGWVTITTPNFDDISYYRIKPKMTKEELERQKWNDIFLEDCAVYDKKIAEEYTTLEEQIAKLKEENKELKEVHESDKRSLRLIAKKGADLEKKLKHAEENCINKTCVVFKDKEDCVAQLLELERENAELQQKWLDESYEKAKCIKSLDDKNKEINYLSEQIQELKIELDTPESVVLDKLDEAKELIKNIIRVTWNEGWNYSLDWKVKAEQFLKECENE